MEADQGVRRLRPSLAVDGAWIDEGDSIATSLIETETYGIDASRATMEDAAAMSAGLARLTARRRYGDPR